MKTLPAHHDPFAARPVHAPHVTTQEVNGKVQLRLGPPPGRGWRAWLDKRFAMFPFRMVCLDEVGTFFWKQIDGSRTLAEIEEQVRGHARMEASQSRDAVILFTKMLMRRSLIALQLPQPTEAAAAGGSR